MTTPSDGPCLEDLARVPRFNSPRLLLVVARSGALACTDFQAGPAATVTGPAGVAMPPVSLGRAPAVPARGRHPGRVGAVARPDGSEPASVPGRSPQAAAQWQRGECHRQWPAGRVPLPALAARHSESGTRPHGPTAACAHSGRRRKDATEAAANVTWRHY